MHDPELVWQIETDPVLQLFLNSITDQAVFTLDPDGIITTWNEGCRRMKRYTSDEAIGEHFRMLYMREDQEQGHPEHNLREAFEHGEYHEERVRVRKDNEPFTANVSIYRLEKDGQHAGFAKIVRDVTERRRLEEQQRAFEERLERSNQELTGFCYSVAHDLRSPIRAIVSKCRIVQEDFAPELPLPARESLNSLVEDGMRLGRFVDDLLSFARLGQGDLKREEVDVSDISRRLAAEIAPHCHDGTAQIEIQDDMMADADPTMLEFVLRNLVENACKYSSPGVRIQIGLQDQNGEPVFYVRDNGIGFDVKYLDRMFEPFQRLHRSDEYKGTGIGLANVRRIIERHGGHVWAESEPGKGSTFFFTLGEKLGSATSPSAQA